MILPRKLKPEIMIAHGSITFLWLIELLDFFSSLAMFIVFRHLCHRQIVINENELIEFMLKSFITMRFITGSYLDTVK